MAEIRPFQGLRFSSEAGNIEALIAPPYDVISPTEREALAAKSPHNVVHVTLPEGKSDDRSKFIKYARSAATLGEWRRDGTLQPEEQPAFYRLRQTFTIPDSRDVFVRTALVALIRVQPYSEGVVLPHEQTFPKHKEDRLRILEATRAHLECIFGLYEDPDGTINAAVNGCDMGPVVKVTGTDGVDNLFEPITDPEQIKSLEAMLADRKVWIADGHHRYETALNFRESIGEREGRVPEDYMLMALTSMSDPGLVLLPTHRIVTDLKINGPDLVEKLSPWFDVDPTQSRNLIPQLEAQPHTFGVAFEGGEGYLFTPKPAADFAAVIGTEGSETLRTLDVTILHRLIFEHVLGRKGLEGIRYTRDAMDAIHAADAREGVAFLMSPPSVEDMRLVALAGERMPQKSTYYYPKIPSGLVLWSLNDWV